MVDGLALCSCACVTCLWCSLLAICFPRFLKKLQETDSDACCAIKSNERNEYSKLFKKKSEPTINCDKIKSSSYPVENLTRTTSRDPRCTVKIIRRTKRQCHRRDSTDDGEEIDSIANDDERKFDNLYKSAKMDKRNTCIYNVAYANPIDSGVQTEFFNRRKLPARLQTNDSGDYVNGNCNRRYKLRAKLNRKISSSEESLAGYKKSGYPPDRENAIGTKKKSKKYSPLFSKKYRTPIVYDCDDHRQNLLNDAEQNYVKVR